MANPSQVLESLTPEAADWLRQAIEQTEKDAAKNLPVLFPQLPRRLGRNPFTKGEHSRAAGDSREARIDLGAWRACDAGALLLLEAQSRDPQSPDPQSTEQFLDLYYHGDMEEKAMVFRAAACMPIGATTVTLLGEAQRTNTSNHFEAAVCDSNVLVRAVEAAGDAFTQAEFNRVVLKLAFVDLPLSRVFDVSEKANPELSRMLQDLATEREAAGRRVWRDTNLLIAQAPTAGTIARIAGGLEHGDDAHRLAAAQGLQYLDDEKVRALARERLDREPVAAIRDAIRSVL